MVSSFANYQAGASLRDAVLRNPAFRRNVLRWRSRTGLKRLRKAWQFLSPMQQAILAFRFGGGEVVDYHTVASQLGVTVSTAQWHEGQASDTLHTYLKDPCAWARLSPRTRNLLIGHGIMWPLDLTRRIVYRLLEGELGPWGPSSSQELNACLDSLGEPRLHERLAPGCLEYAEADFLRRLGPVYPPVLLNQAFVQVVRHDRHRRPTLSQLMPAWRALDDRQRAALSALYRHDRGPGGIAYMEAADQLSISTHALRRCEAAAVEILRAAAYQRPVR